MTNNELKILTEKEKMHLHLLSNIQGHQLLIDNLKIALENAKKISHYKNFDNRYFTKLLENTAQDGYTRDNGEIVKYNAFNVRTTEYSFYIYGDYKYKYFTGKWYIDNEQPRFEYCKIDLNADFYYKDNELTPSTFVNILSERIEIYESHQQERQEVIDNLDNHLMILQDYFNQLEITSKHYNELNSNIKWAYSLTKGQQIPNNASYFNMTFNAITDNQQ